MGLSQTALDQMATTAFLALGALVQAVTWHHKASATGAISNSTVSIRFEQYKFHEIDLLQVLRNDRKARVKTAAISFVPTVWDSFTPADGSYWKIMDIAGGVGYPFYLCQARQAS